MREDGRQNAVSGRSWAPGAPLAPPGPRTRLRPCQGPPWAFRVVFTTAMAEAVDDLCLSMLRRLLVLLRRPRTTDFLHHYRAQLNRLQIELEVVKDGLLRGDITIEDLGQE